MRVATLVHAITCLTFGTRLVATDLGSWPGCVGGMGGGRNPPIRFPGATLLFELLRAIPCPGLRQSRTCSRMRNIACMGAHGRPYDYIGGDTRNSKYL